MYLLCLDENEEKKPTNQLPPQQHKSNKRHTEKSWIAQYFKCACVCLSHDPLHKRVFIQKNQRFSINRRRVSTHRNRHTRIYGILSMKCLCAKKIRMRFDYIFPFIRNNSADAISFTYSEQPNEKQKSEFEKKRNWRKWKQNKNNGRNVHILITSFGA